MVEKVEHSFRAKTGRMGLRVFRNAFDGVRAHDSAIARHRREGSWRAGSLLTDLWKWRDQSPSAPAIVAYRSGERVQLSYAEFAEWVERFAAGLAELGVGPGTVIAIQLPNWWEANALVLAAIRVGAVVAPLVPTLGEREQERILRRIGAAVCVTPEEWNGTDYASRMAGLAARLPQLKQRMIFGRARRPGEISFADHFVHSDWRPRQATTLAAIDVDPDRAAVVLFTSGTTGNPQGAVHSLNTLYALGADFVRVWGHGSADRYFTPHWSLHLAGMVCGIVYPLLVGGCCVMIDAWTPETAPAMLAAEEITYLGGAPVFLTALMTELHRQERAIPSVRIVFAFGTTVPPQLVTKVADTFGVALGAAWGMTEAGYIFTRPSDPADWAAHSVGRPSLGTEIQLRATEPITETQPGRLMIRGAGVCVAILDRDEGGITLTRARSDGWYDTGDLAIPDGRGGIRLMGRAADRIGGVLMVPATDVEAALRDHPAVADVALVGVPDPDGTEQVCAVIVPTGESPQLGELRDFLTGVGMTEWYLPTRSVTRTELPYNAMGKVNKVLLKKQLTAP
jgi:cyclohexanecarboxylate-CoA ligase